MKNPEVVQALMEDRAELLRQIEAIDVVLDRWRNDTSPLSNGSASVPNRLEGAPRNDSEDDAQDLLGPTRAIKSLFVDNPSRNWTIPRLRDELVEMIENKLVITENSDVLGGAWTVVRTLVKQGFISKTKKGFYRLKMKEDASA